MTNKQAIITFIVGVGFLLAAFWAGMNVAKYGRAPSASADTTKNRGTTGSTARADSGSPGAASTTASNGKDSVEASSYIVRVAAFGTEDKADKLAIELRHKYLSAHTEEPVAGDDSLYRVDIGPYERRDEAEQVARELATEGRKGVMIIPGAKR